MTQVNPLEKAPTGIQGFDAMTLGGLPRGRTTLVLGPPGTGKTTFALQTLVNGAQITGEPGIFVAFEEGAAQIRANAAGMGWDLPSLEREKLFFLDARIPLDTVQAGDFDISGMLARIEDQAQKMQARRMVFDAVDVLLALLDDAGAERREMYRLHQWIQSRDYTGIITAKVNPGEHQMPARYDFLQFMADSVVRLEQDTHQLISERHLQIVKYRGSGFVENRAPLLISDDGMRVAAPNPMNLQHPVFEERVSSGVAQLDDMLTGGFYRGSNILITGAPGTAKSTLSGAFIDAACRRGERALFVSFDETADEIVRNLRSVNIDLQPHRDAGLLRMYTAYSGYQSAEAHLMQLRREIQAHDPRCVVIDPLSAILKSGARYSAEDVAERLLYGNKAQGITTLCTSLMEAGATFAPGTALSVSTIADTWIHLSFHLQGGEQNRALHVIKSRGTAHSNQMRELLLHSTGVTLTDVYTAGGEVLMGTLRWEREEELRRQTEEVQRAREERRRDLRQAAADVEARMASLQRELEQGRAELERLDTEWSRLDAQYAGREQRHEARRESVRQMRLGAAGSRASSSQPDRGQTDSRKSDTKEEEE